MSGSYYTLNSKYNQLTSILASLPISGSGLTGDLDANNYDILNVDNITLTTINGLPPAGAENLEQTLTIGNSAGTNDINMNSQDILAVNNIDLATINGSAYPPTADTLQQVLTAGNDSDLSVILKDDLTTPTATNTIDENGSVIANATHTFQLLNLVETGVGTAILNPQAFLLESLLPGGGSIPMLTLNQKNTNTGSATIRMYKNISTNGSAIGELSFVAKTASATDREYARIAGTIRNNNGSNIDGSVGLFARVNDNLTEIVRINGADSQIEIFQPLDLNDKDIVSSTGDIELDAYNSSGTGDVNLKAKGNVNITAPTGGQSINLTSLSSIDIEATGDNLTLTAGSAMVLETTGIGTNIEFKTEDTAGGIVFTGNALVSNSAGGDSGNYLVITLNGVKYKINLQSDF
jgi:hypothetical protein